MEAAGDALDVPTGLVVLGRAADAVALPFEACRFAVPVEGRGAVAASASAGWFGLAEPLPPVLGVGPVGTAAVGVALAATVLAPLVLEAVGTAMPFVPGAVLPVTAGAGLVEPGAAAGAAAAIETVDGPAGEVGATAAAGLAEPLAEPLVEPLVELARLDPASGVLAMPFAGVEAAGRRVEAADVGAAAFDAAGVETAGVPTGAVDTVVVAVGGIAPPELAGGAAACIAGPEALGCDVGLPLVALVARGAGLSGTVETAGFAAGLVELAGAGTGSEAVWCVAAAALPVALGAALAGAVGTGVADGGV